MQRGWVGEVAGLFFFSLQKLFPMRADEVGTNHPIEYTSEEIHVIQEGTKQVFLNTKMHCIWDNNTLFDRFMWIYSLFSDKSCNFAANTTNN